MERRLAAILAADVVGYSRLMGHDEAATLKRLKALRTELVQPSFASRKGRIVKLMGDGLLAEFPSIVEAVQSAIDIQRRINDRETDLPDDSRIRLRIGVNLGDIIIEGQDIYGDGVNVAARVEEMAPVGGVAISGSAHDHVIGKVDAAFEDQGEQLLKNITRTVRIWTWARSDPHSSGKHDSVPPPDRPSVAVLPFDNISGDPEQLYFSDGITEDIITELSRFKSMDVVARNSTFVYRDQAVNVSEIGRKVGASHLLEGSVRKSGSRIRLTAQLIDVKTGKHVWADRYDRELSEIFELQDELVHSLVSALAVRLSAAETERSLRRPMNSPAAYDLYLRASSLDRLYNANTAREAKELASQAVGLDPGFARAHAVLAGQIFTCGWFENTPKATYLEEALQAAAKAVELDPNDSFCSSTRATVHLQRREFDQARHYSEQALKSNPHDTWVWSDYAWYLNSVGKPEEALERLDSMEHFEPYPPNWHWEIRGQVLYNLKRYGEAKTALERMTVTPFWVKAFLAACCGQLGEVEAAKTYWAEAIEGAPDKGDTFAHQLDVYRDTADAEHWVKGLRRAELDV